MVKRTAIWHPAAGRVSPSKPRVNADFVPDTFPDGKQFATNESQRFAVDVRTRLDVPESIGAAADNSQMLLDAEACLRRQRQGRGGRPPTLLVQDAHELRRLRHKCVRGFGGANALHELEEPEPPGRVAGQRSRNRADASRDCESPECELRAEADRADRLANGSTLSERPDRARTPLDKRDYSRPGEGQEFAHRAKSRSDCEEIHSGEVRGTHAATFRGASKRSAQAAQEVTWIRPAGGCALLGSNNTFCTPFGNDDSASTSGRSSTNAEQPSEPMRCSLLSSVGSRKTFSGLQARFAPREEAPLLEKPVRGGMQVVARARDRGGATCG